MTPPRLALLVATLVALLLVTFVTINRTQRRAFAQSLIADFAALDTWSVEGHGTAFENGFQCFADHARQLTADDVQRLRAFAGHSEPEAMADAGTLLIWATDARRCVDARHFSPVSGMQSTSVAANEAVEPLEGGFIRLSIFDVKQKLETGAFDEAAVTCVELAEHLIALSHVSLIDNMYGWMGVRMMSTPCARAWASMSDGARQRLGERIERLPRELAPNAEWLRIERTTEEFIVFSEALTPEEHAALPALTVTAMELGPARYTAPTAWVNARRRFDELISLADTPGSARSDASDALDEAFATWMLGTSGAIGSPNYEKFLARRDDVKRAFFLFADIAARRAPTLPPRANVQDGGVIWQLDAEHSLFFPQ